MKEPPPARLGQPRGRHPGGLLFKGNASRASSSQTGTRPLPFPQIPLTSSSRRYLQDVGLTGIVIPTPPLTPLRAPAPGYFRR